jgi:hypothetical protein
MYIISFSSLEHMLGWKFRARKQSKKLKIFKRDAFANQRLSAYVETDLNNYDDDSTVDSQTDKKQTEPLVRIMPSGVNFINILHKSF